MEKEAEWFQCPLLEMSFRQSEWHEKFGDVILSRGRHNRGFMRSGVLTAVLCLVSLEQKGDFVVVYRTRPLLLKTARDITGPLAQCDHQFKRAADSPTRKVGVQ